MNTGNPKIMLLVFGLVALAQLAVPGSMILKREETLKNGDVFRFKTRPVDPYDAFRGRYVALGFEQNQVSVTNAASFRRGRKIYVRLETDADGFARLGEVVARRPSSGVYLKTKVLYAQPGLGKVMVALPFDRYYMNEQEAPEAERAYNTASRREARTAYAAVRVQAGMAVIEDLFVDGVPIKEFLSTQKAD